MAIRKKVATAGSVVAAATPAVTKKAPAVKATPAVSNTTTVEGVLSGIHGVTVTRSFTVPGNGQFESMKFGVTVGDVDYETASARLDGYMLSEAQKAAEQFSAIAAGAKDLMEAVGAEDVVEDDEEAVEDEEEGFDIDTATREEIAEYIAEAELDIDPAEKQFAGKKGLVALRAAVTAAATEEGEEEADADEEVEADDEEAADEEDDLTEEQIKAMKRSELTALIAKYELDIDPADHKKTPGLVAAVLEAMTEDDDADADAEDADADEESEDEEEAEADAEEEAEGYTRDELEKMKVADLEEIWKAWSIKGKFPAGAVAVKKKAAITKILEVQEKGA